MITLYSQKDSLDANEIKTESEDDEKKLPKLSENKCEVRDCSKKLNFTRFTLLIFFFPQNMKTDDENVSGVKLEPDEKNVIVKKEIKEEGLVELAAILDETKGWVKFAEKVGCTFLVHFLKENKESSPALTVINYALVRNRTFIFIE